MPLFLDGVLYFILFYANCQIKAEHPVSMLNGNRAILKRIFHSVYFCPCKYNFTLNIFNTLSIIRYYSFWTK